MELIKDRYKREGIIATVIFHLILLIVFIFCGMTYTVPPPEYGMLVNFGDSEMGSGDVEPVESGAPVIEEAEELPEQVEETNPETPEPVQEQIITQDIEEAPEVVEQPKEEKPKEIETETPPKEKVEEKPKEEEKPKVNKNLSNAFNKLKNTKTKSGGSQGNDENATGNKGKQNGVPGVDNYDGNGKGDGDYYLDGRTATLVKPIDDSQEEGIVVVEVIVDRTGRVLKARPGAKGSTTTSANLFRKAKEAALKTKFSAKPDAPFEQKGFIKYKFILG